MSFSTCQPISEPSQFLQAKASNLGAQIFAINGIADHVHLVVSIPPSVAVATFVGQVKGAASARHNAGRSDVDPIFSWQDGYGAFTFDGKRLPNVIAYVANQKEHHEKATTIPVLERSSS